MTEREVRRGLVNAKDIEKHCLAYTRNIENINLSAIRYARNYIDMIGRDVDEEAQILLSTLRDEKVGIANRYFRIVDHSFLCTGPHWAIGAPPMPKYACRGISGNISKESNMSCKYSMETRTFKTFKGKSLCLYVITGYLMNLLENVGTLYKSSVLFSACAMIMAIMC